MKRAAWMALAFTLLALVSSPVPALAQFKTMGDDRNPKTGQTDEGVKVDQEIDKLYRARAGQKTPEVRSDPWSDVRTPPAAPAVKSKKQP